MTSARIHQEDEQNGNMIVFGAVCTFRYTNYKEETALRTVIPHCIRFGITDHHKPKEKDPTVQPDNWQGGTWLLEAYDCDRKELRTFAIRDIHPR